MAVPQQEFKHRPTVNKPTQKVTILAPNLASVKVSLIDDLNYYLLSFKIPHKGLYIVILNHVRKYHRL